MSRFKYSKVFWLSLLFLCSCNISEHKEVDPYEFQSRITDSSVLYFKNIRQLYYDKTVHEPSKMEQFRFGSRVQSDDEPIVNLCIVLNILTDRGYIMVEPNEFLQVSDTLTVEWSDIETNESGEYQFTTSSMPKNYQFAAEVYASLQKRHQMKIKVGDKSYPFLEKEEEKEAFRITMFDYFRIVGAVR